ncbi:MAG: hypothetical protein LBK73_03715 [Treponema sp.]|nr:hypothetical protein [Treponema sp.]
MKYHLNLPEVSFIFSAIHLREGRCRRRLMIEVWEFAGFGGLSRNDILLEIVIDYTARQAAIPSFSFYAALRIFLNKRRVASDY